MLSLGIRYFILDLICDVNYCVSRTTAICVRGYIGLNVNVVSAPFIISQS